MRTALVALGVALIAAPAASARMTATTGSEPGAGRIVIARDDGSHRRVLAGGDVSWISPNGRRVAVMDYAHGNGGGNPRFKLFRASGGPPLHVIREDLFPAVWSPDSKQLIASTGIVTRTLVLIDAATGAVTTLATGEFDAASFSPDSTQVVAARHDDNGGSALVVIDLATHAARTIRDGAGSPVWGPHAIAFATIREQARHTVEDVATIQPDGTGFRRLTHRRVRLDDTGLYPVDWSANGRRVLARQYGISGATGFDAYGVDAVHGGAHRIARGVDPVALTPDGRFAIGETGNPFCCSTAPVTVVRVPWRGGKRRIVLRKAFDASRSD